MGAIQEPKQFWSSRARGEVLAPLALSGRQRRVAWAVATATVAAVFMSAWATGAPLDRADPRAEAAVVRADDGSGPATIGGDSAPLLDLLPVGPGGSSSTLMSPPNLGRARAIVHAAARRGNSTRVPGAGDIPARALRAYRAAAAALAASDPSCGLDWALLAGIGKVESNHGRYGGSQLGADGVARPRIIGIALDGRPGVARIRDTDRGALDGDTTFDRAVGPMQFIPGTWAGRGADGDHDGVADPHDINDAALAAGRYLCAGDARLDGVEGARGALMRYNFNAAYGVRVLRLAAAYRLGRGVAGSSSVTFAAGTFAAGTFAAGTQGARRVEFVAPLRPGGSGARARAPWVIPGGAPSSPVVASRPPSEPPVFADPTPEPNPAPGEGPDPTPVVTPDPTPTPDPEPAPAPDPTPAPAPTPAPDPTPDPLPAPDPIPVPDPIPAPDPVPVPDPVPNPTPAPDPAPSPDPTEPPPVTDPAPTPDPTLCPVPSDAEPITPDPAPTCIPVIE